MNRIYETDISISVHIKNVPEAVKLEDGNRIVVKAHVKGYGTALFGYIFDNNVNIQADYSDFVRHGGRIAMPVVAIRNSVLGKLEPEVLLVGFENDSLATNVKRVSAMVPVKKDIGELTTMANCVLVSVAYSPDSVMVTALTDVMPRIKEVCSQRLVCRDIAGDTVLSLALLPGEYIDVRPRSVEAHIVVSHYVEKTLEVPVEYVGFPGEVQLGLLPKVAAVKFEVLEMNADRVVVSDFSVKLDYKDYVGYITKSADVPVLAEKLQFSCSSPYVRNAELLPVTFFDTCLLHTHIFEFPL